jgi:plasmid stability protein
LKLQASDEYNAGMQYTLRNIPKNLDRALRDKARAERKSLNAVALDALKRGLGLNGEAVRYDDLDWFFGGNTIDANSLKAMAEHDVVHPDDWR